MERMVGIKCNTCNCEIDTDEGGVVGEFGILPVAFCVWCLPSLIDMVIQLQGYNDVDILKDIIHELEND